MFIDETAAATNMERRYGRAELARAHAERSSVGCAAQGLRGERCCIAVPHGNYKTTSVTADLRASGPFAISLGDAPTTGARFLAYVTDALVPALTPGDTVVLDNLACHKVAGVRKAIEALGAHLLYLPPYSLDFYPIEMAFAKLKTFLRTAAARTVSDLWTAIRQAFTRFTPAECRNYLEAAGYDAYDPS